MVLRLIRSILKLAAETNRGTRIDEPDDPSLIYLQDYKGDTFAYCMACDEPVENGCTCNTPEERRGKYEKKSRATPSLTGRTRNDWSWNRAEEYEYDHYTDAVDDIKQLKREKRHDEVIELLNWCIDYTEAEAETSATVNSQPAPAYYRHLGIVLRKEDRYQDEVDVLERYVQWFDEHGGEPREELVERLERARELASDD